MSHPRSLPHPKTPATSARRRGSRAGACAGALLASVTTLFSLGALHAAPAVAAPAPAEQAHRAAAATRPGPAGSPSPCSPTPSSLSSEPTN
ncbi:hypothetical protein AB0K74_18540, partial [Streptomyces sp. NPDC056159]